jgi:hypothetical protein
VKKSRKPLPCQPIFSEFTHPHAVAAKAVAVKRLQSRTPVRQGADSNVILDINVEAYSTLARLLEKSQFIHIIFPSKT